jgi:hypothetical protein
MPLCILQHCARCTPRKQVQFAAYSMHRQVVRLPRGVQVFAVLDPMHWAGCGMLLLPCFHLQIQHCWCPFSVFACQRQPAVFPPPGLARSMLSLAQWQGPLGAALTGCARHQWMWQTGMAHYLLNLVPLRLVQQEHGGSQ